MSSQKIYLVCGFHVNFYHSWRGDRNDRTGFGMTWNPLRMTAANVVLVGHALFAKP